MILFNFFGREASLPRNLSDKSILYQKLQELNFEFNELLLLNQHHSDEVYVVDSKNKIYSTNNLPKADGIVTNLTNLPIGILTADCGPVLFFDEDKKIIGACHAGWKGAKAGIIANTILEMKKLGATDIKAIIGPTIQQYSYQVSKDFYDNFLEESSQNVKFFKIGKEADKWQFDLPSYISEKIAKAGVYDIENLEIDTYTNQSKYFSYRKYCHESKPLDGNNIAIISINDSQ